MISAECGFDGGNARLDLQNIGPTLKVNVIRLQLNETGMEVPAESLNDVDALVDTGAVMCFIDEAVARTLKLLLIDRQTICGAGGAHEANVHLAGIQVPALRYELWGRFAGVNLSAGGQQHGVLLGRNLLSDFVMNYDGLKGKVAISQPEQSIHSSQ
jgi:predicted aspartyl protease